MKVMDSGVLPSKIRSQHLERKAVVYVRQSHPRQVLVHPESAALQYALRQKAQSFGWHADRVEVIDDDQGHSGATTAGRIGFQRLVAEVTLDHVGIIFGYELSRLARSDDDWRQLIKLCAVFNTLVADRDGVYDPKDTNDQLILGIKSMFSELELHVLKGRMKEARDNKAKRGELFNHAPIGYMRSPSGDMVIDPDQQVQSIVHLIFDKFDELQTLNALVRYLTKHEIRIPVRPHFGPNRGNLEWHRPVRATLQCMLKHPIYAGAYRWGHRSTDPRAQIPGRPATGRKIRPAEDSKVLLKGRLPAYITWTRYLAIRDRLEQNRSRAESMGAPRKGPALLSGLVTCGVCGNKMTVGYQTQGKSVAWRYNCYGDYTQYGASPCQSFSGKALDALVAEQVLAVIKPASLELALATCEDIEKERSRLLKDWEQRLERAKYEAEKAALHYYSVDPQNRLVAADLEHRWEETLLKQRKLKEDYDGYLSTHHKEFTTADREAIQRIASDIPTLWGDPNTPVQDRQQIVQILLKQAIVRVVPGAEMLDVALEWRLGDVFTHHEVLRPVARYEQLKDYQALLDHVVALHDQGLSTEEIAAQLNTEGWHPPKLRSTFNRPMVADLLSRKRALTKRPTGERGKNPLKKDEWWLDDLARALGMPIVTLHGWIYRHQWIEWRRFDRRLVLWADKDELARLRELREWNRHRHGWPTEPPPARLTTPKRLSGTIQPPRQGDNCHEIKEKKEHRDHQAARGSRDLSMH